MWLFTKKGMVSVVNDWDNINKLLVRSRDKAVLEYYSQGRYTIYESPHSDYLFRMILDKDVFKEMFLDKIIAELDYPNFKDEVKTSLPGYAYNVYTSVWHVGLGLERRDERARVESLAAN